MSIIRYCTPAIYWTSNVHCAAPHGLPRAQCPPHDGPTGHPGPHNVRPQEWDRRGVPVVPKLSWSAYPALREQKSLCVPCNCVWSTATYGKWLRWLWHKPTLLLLFYNGNAADIQMCLMIHLDIYHPAKDFNKQLSKALP